MDKKLIYGAAYYYEYLPIDRLEEDMTMMNKAGINMIRIAESTWSTWEPRDNEFDFTYLHKVLKAATAHGIDVIVGTPTYALPSWLANKFPDILCESHSGVDRYGRRQNFDITHPGFLFHAERIIRRLMMEVKDYDCVIGFQLDNETKAYDTCSPRAQKMFKERLKKDFVTTDALNREMGLAYWSNSIAEWDDLPDVRGTINASFGAEYEAFQRDLVAEYLMWQRQIVDEYRRPDQFVTHNFDYGWKLESKGIHPEINQYDSAAAVTVAGCDIYHSSEDKLTGDTISFGGAVAYSLLKNNYYVLETEAQGNFGWLPYPGQLRLQAFAHIASGANCVSYWHWHSTHNAIESYWKGILSHDFSEGAVYKEAMTIGADFARLSDKLVNLKKHNKVAIMVSNRSLNGLKWFPTAHQQADGDIPDYGVYLRWICDTCYRLNIEYDLINDTTRDFSRYDVVITPTLYSVETELTDSLKDYVKNGGHLISTFKSFFADKYLKISHLTQPSLMTDCFGLHYDRFTNPSGVGLNSSKINTEGSVVSTWMELLETDSDTEVICSYKHHTWGDIPAITHHSYEKGSAAYLGCYFDDATLEEVIKYLFKKWELPLCEHTFPLIVKKGTNDAGKEITYYMNFSKDTLKFANPASGTELIKNVMVGSYDMIELDPWEFAIIES